jgi:hypothetical protein
MAIPLIQSRFTLYLLVRSDVRCTRCPASAPMSKVWLRRSIHHTVAVRTSEIPISDCQARCYQSRVPIFSHSAQHALLNQSSDQRRDWRRSRRSRRQGRGSRSDIHRSILLSLDFPIGRVTTQRLSQFWPSQHGVVLPWQHVCACSAHLLLGSLTHLCPRPKGQVLALYA